MFLAVVILTERQVNWSTQMTVFSLTLLHQI